MTFTLKLPAGLRKAQWKVKIRDKETCEPPHVTVIYRTKSWRINLRTGEFMDEKPSPSEVPRQILRLVKEKNNWNRLCKEWDNLYPSNPVPHAPEKEE